MRGKVSFLVYFVLVVLKKNMDVFLDLRADQKTIISARIFIFQFIYNITGVSLVEARYNTFSRKTAACVIKPESLPPTQGAAAQHSVVLIFNFMTVCYSAACH